MPVIKLCSVRFTTLHWVTWTDSDAWNSNKHPLWELRLCRITVVPSATQNVINTYTAPSKNSGSFYLEIQTNFQAIFTASPTEKCVFQIVCVWSVASVVSDSLRRHGLYPARFLCPWASPSKNTGVSCHAILQVFSPTQGSNLCLLHLLNCRRFFTHWATWELDFELTCVQFTSYFLWLFNELIFINHLVFGIK